MDRLLLLLVLNQVRWLARDPYVQSMVECKGSVNSSS